MGSIADSGGQFSSRVLLLLRIENNRTPASRATGRQGAPVRRIRPMFHPLTWISPVFAGSFTIPLGTARIQRDRSGIEAGSAGPGPISSGVDARPAGRIVDGAHGRWPLPDARRAPRLMPRRSMSRVYVAERYVSNKDNDAASIRELPLALPPLPHLASPT